MSKKNNIKSRYFLTCDYASTDAEGKMNILGVFRNIIAGEKMPTRHPLFFIVGEFIFNKNGVYYLKIIINDTKSEETLFEDKRELKIKIPKDKKSGDLRLIIRVENLVFKKLGDYNVSFFVDEKKIADSSISVSKK